MQPPCEIMVTDFLPNIRGLVSHELHQRGVSQNRIASLLGITQARVSNYLATEKANYQNRLLSDFEISQLDLQGYAKILADDVTRSQTDGVFTLYSIWKNLLFSGAVCNIHRRKSAVPADCSICMELHRPSSEQKVSRIESEDSFILKDLSDAVSAIEKSIEFPSIMPEVSVNIAMCRENPKMSRDVAAIPGRINRIHGRAKALIMPEFGCSNHMSKVLMIFYSKNNEFRAAMNIKYDKIIGSIISKMRRPKLFTLANIEDANLGKSRKKKDASSGYQKKTFGWAFNHKEDELLSRLGKINLPVDISFGEIFIVVDQGSEGLEPITYLFGPRATDIAQIALRIAQSYSLASRTS